MQPFYIKCAYSIEYSVVLYSLLIRVPTLARSAPGDLFFVGFYLSMNQPRSFIKPALKPADLIKHLEAKGLLVTNTALAERSLATIGYYRLLIYTRPFQDKTKKFIQNSKFEDVLELYEFDRNLRLLCLDAIEKIEVALRSSIVNSLAVQYGPHFYTNSVHYHRPDSCSKFMSKVNSAGDLGISHYRRNYSHPTDPPIWAMLEAATFGATSRLFADLTPDNRKEVARLFEYDESILVSWFRTLTVFRNLCAHHNRLWNFKYSVNQPKKAKALRSVFNDNNSFHARAIVLIALLKKIDPHSDWKMRLINLLDSAPQIAQPKALGFPENWKTEPFWKV